MIEIVNEESKCPTEIELRLDIIYLSKLVMNLAFIEGQEDLFQDAANYSLYNHTKIEEYINQDYENRKHVKDLEKAANVDATEIFEFDDCLKDKYKEWVENFSKTLNFIDKQGNPVDSNGNAIKTIEVGEVDENKFTDFFKNSGNEE